MRRALSIPFAVAVLCAVAAVHGPNVALAAAPHGALTKLEYRQFSTWLADYAAFNKGKLQKGVAACRALGSSTALLQAARDSCAGDLALDLSPLTLQIATQACDTAATGTATSTTTTPTTTSSTTTTASTTPTVSGITGTQLQEYVCLKPVYQYLSRTVANAYSLDAVTRRAAIERGLTGHCLDTIVATPKQLSDERKMASADKRVVADVVVLQKLQAGQVAAGAVDGGAVKADSHAFNRAFEQLSKDATPNRLTTCLHA